MSVVVVSDSVEDAVYISEITSMKLVDLSGADTVDILDRELCEEPGCVFFKDVFTKLAVVWNISATDEISAEIFKILGRKNSPTPFNSEFYTVDNILEVNKDVIDWALSRDENIYIIITKNFSCSRMIRQVSPRDLMFCYRSSVIMDELLRSPPTSPHDFPKPISDPSEYIIFE